MAHLHSKAGARSGQVPKGGIALKKFIIDSTIERAGDLLNALGGYRYSESRGCFTGRIGYSNESMLRTALLRMLNKRRYAKDFVEELRVSRHNRLICQLLDENTPSESCISRFQTRLSKHSDLLWKVITEVTLVVGERIEEARKAGLLGSDAPPFGHILAIDSTDIEAHSDPSRRPHIDPTCPKPDKPNECRSKLPNCCKPSDINAVWGFRTDKNSPTGVSPFFGYKLHTICDAYYGTPLHALLLPANKSDTKQLRPLVEETLKRYPWLAPKYLLADKGYDSTENFVWLDSIGITPIIAVRKPKKKKGRKSATYDAVSSDGAYEGTYDRNGFPLCAGNVSMEYVGTDAERGHLFRCRRGGCHLKNTLFPVYCNDDDWEKPEGALLRIIGKIPRFTKRWKEIYKLRQAIERFFGSGKRSRLLDKQQYLTMDKVAMHTTMSLLSYSSTMLARLLSGDFARMRHMRV